MKKKSWIQIIFIATFFLVGNFIYLADANAISGACSWHDGVDCSAGADWDGSVICNDGWRNSSVAFSSMSMCDDNSCGERPIQSTYSYIYEKNRLEGSGISEDAVIAILAEKKKLFSQIEEAIALWDLCDKKWQERLLQPIFPENGKTFRPSCSDQVGRQSIIRNGECKCDYSYISDSKTPFSCISISSYCYNNLGKKGLVKNRNATAEDSLFDICECEQGSIFDGQICSSISSFCKQKLGEKSIKKKGSYYEKDSLSDLCGCVQGYEINKDQTSCARISLDSKSKPIQQLNLDGKDSLPINETLQPKPPEKLVPSLKKTYLEKQITKEKSEENLGKKSIESLRIEDNPKKSKNFITRTFISIKNFFKKLFK